MFSRTNYFYYDYYYFGEAVLWINICTASGSLTSVSATETSVPSCSDGSCPASCRDRLTMFSASHLCEESNTKDRPFHSALIQPRLHYRLGPPAGRRCALPCWAIDDVLLLKGSCYYCSLIWLRLKRSVRFSQESNLDLLRGGRGRKRRCCIFNIITGGVNGTPGHLESLWSLSTPRLGRPGARNGAEIQRRSVFLHWLNEAHQVFFIGFTRNFCFSQQFCIFYENICIFLSISSSRSFDLSTLLREI